MRRLPSIKLAASANALLTDNPEGLSIEPLAMYLTNPVGSNLALNRPL